MNLPIRSLLPYATQASRTSTLHGPDHWQRVVDIGVELARETPGADPHVVRLFAYLHDSQRFSDGHDPDHGRRAAALVPMLQGRLFEATDRQLAVLVAALAEHADGFVTEDPTIACCWDADRLDLPRCGIRPVPEMLSTQAARRRVWAA